MGRIMGTTLTLAVLLALPVEGQRRGHQGRMGMERETPATARLLGLREQLSLTDEQVEQLEGLRTVGREVQSRSQTEMRELRDRMRDGTITREEFRGRMETHRATAEQRRTARRGQVDAVLTEEQREQVESLRKEGAVRRGARHARSMRRGRGHRQGPGAARGPAGRAGFRARAFAGRGGVAWGVRGFRGPDRGVRARAFYMQGRRRFGPGMFPRGG